MSLSIIGLYAGGVCSRDDAERYTNQRQNIATLSHILTQDQFDSLHNCIEDDFAILNPARATLPIKWQEAAEALKGVSKDSISVVLQRTIARLAKK